MPVSPVLRYKTVRNHNPEHSGQCLAVVRWEDVDPVICGAPLPCRREQLRHICLHHLHVRLASQPPLCGTKRRSSVGSPLRLCRHRCCSWRMQARHMVACSCAIAGRASAGATSATSAASAPCALATVTGARMPWRHPRYLPYTRGGCSRSWGSRDCVHCTQAARRPCSLRAARVTCSSAHLALRPRHAGRRP
jgi:hypothetical protein